MDITTYIQVGLQCGSPEDPQGPSTCNWPLNHGLSRVTKPLAVGSDTDSTRAASELNQIIGHPTSAPKLVSAGKKAMFGLKVLGV